METKTSSISSRNIVLCTPNSWIRFFELLFRSNFRRRYYERHFFTCRTSSVSCVDCGKTFDRAEAASHISCITEKEKYEKQQVSKKLAERLEGDTNLYCSTCSLAFNSALQGEQHYQSKRHASAAKKRLQNANGTGYSSSGALQTENNPVQETKSVANGQSTSVTNGKHKSSSSKMKNTDKKESKDSKRKAGLKKAIKKLVASKGTIRLHSLIKRLQEEGFSSTDLEKRVREKIKKSRKLFMDGKRIKLKN